MIRATWSEVRRLRTTVLALHEPGHRDVVAATHDLGLTLSILGRPAEAEPLLREAVDGAMAIWGEHNRVTGSFSGDLARCLVDLGKVEEAEPLLLRANQVVEEALGAAHPDTLRIARETARMYDRRGCLVEAAAWRAVLARRGVDQDVIPVSR